MGASKELFCEEMYKEPVRIDVILRKIKRELIGSQHDEIINNNIVDRVVSVLSIEYIFQKYGIEMNRDNEL